MLSQRTWGVVDLTGDDLAMLTWAVQVGRQKQHRVVERKRVGGGFLDHGFGGPDLKSDEVALSGGLL